MVMALYPYELYSQRIDRTKNVARYYLLTIQPTLFGDAAVVRFWGRVGKRGGEKREMFSTELEAAIHFLALARKKHRKGYRPVGNCGNGLPQSYGTK